MKARLKRWSKRFAILGGIFVLLLLPLVVSWAWTCFYTPPLEPGPDTTIETEPLRADGTVDYVAILNERGSEGVTAENNAFVPIAALLPEQAFPSASFRAATFEALNVDAPDDDAIAFEGIRDYRDRQKAQNPDSPWAAYIEPGQDDDRGPGLRWEIEWERALEAPWSDEQLPLVAEWLNRQTDILDRFTEAIARERFWAPLILEEPGQSLPNAPQRYLSWTSAITFAVKARALRRIEKGELERAMEDAVALRRLGRHIGRTPRVIELNVAMGASERATDLVTHLAAQDELTADQARRLQQELADAAERFLIEDAIDLGERYALLDTLQLQEVNDYTIDFEDCPITLVETIDRNRAMRRTNRIVDRLVEAIRAATPAERMEALDREWERSIDNRVRWVLPSSNWMSIFAGRRDALTDATVDVLLQVFFPSRTTLRVDETNLRDRLAAVALAVAGYRAEHGTYPPSLDELTPDWLENVPADIFDPQGGPLRYRLEPARVAIYSVGPNGEEDSGRIFPAGCSSVITRGAIAAAIPAPRRPPRERRWG